MAKSSAKKAAVEIKSPTKIEKVRPLDTNEGQVLRSALTLRNKEDEKFYVLLYVKDVTGGEAVDVDERRGPGKWTGNLVKAHPWDNRIWTAELMCIATSIHETGPGDIIDVDITVTSSTNPPPVNESAVIFP